MVCLCCYGLSSALAIIRTRHFLFNNLTSRSSRSGSSVSFIPLAGTGNEKRPQPLDNPLKIHYLCTISHHQQCCPLHGDAIAVPSVILLVYCSAERCTIHQPLLLTLKPRKTPCKSTIIATATTRATRSPGSHATSLQAPTSVTSQSSHWSPSTASLTCASTTSPTSQVVKPVAHTTSPSTSPSKS